MKYVIKYTYKLYDDPNVNAIAYVSGIKMPKFRERPKIPIVEWSPYLYNAILYYDWGAANVILDAVRRKDMDGEVEIYHLEDKELFTARLTQT